MIEHLVPIESQKKEPEKKKEDKRVLSAEEIEKIREARNKQKEEKKKKKEDKIKKLKLNMQKHPQAHKKSVQKTKERSENPYAWGDDITSHHVIPHNILEKISEYLGDQGIKGRAYFLPNFDNLSIKMLKKVGVIEIHQISSDELFSQMKKEIRENLIFKIEGVDFAYNDFKNKYEEYQINPEEPDFIKKEKDPLTLRRLEDFKFGLDELAKSFYEWQGGNLFYGPERAEPMKSDQFDFDAQYYMEKDQMNLLMDYYDIFKHTIKELEDVATTSSSSASAASSSPESQKTDLKEMLLNGLKQLSGNTKDKTPRPYKKEKFFIIKNDIQKLILGKYIADRKLEIDKAIPIDDLIRTKSAYFEEFNGFNDLSLFEIWQEYVYNQNIIKYDKDKKFKNFKYIDMDIIVASTTDDGEQYINLTFAGFSTRININKISDEGAINKAVTDLFDRIFPQ